MEGLTEDWPKCQISSLLKYRQNQKANSKQSYNKNGSVRRVKMSCKKESTGVKYEGEQ